MQPLYQAVGPPPWLWRAVAAESVTSSGQLQAASATLSADGSVAGLSVGTAALASRAAALHGSGLTSGPSIGAGSLVARTASIAARVARTRNPLFGRHDWTQDPGVVLSGGAWRSLANILDNDPSKVAEAIDRDPTSSTFDCDLGATRKVAVLYFQPLLTTTSGRMQVLAGTDPSFATITYDSGIVPTWPQQSAPLLELSQWSLWSASGAYDQSEYSALGFPRFFVPSRAINCRYIRVAICDETALRPPRIGTFSAFDCWEMPWLAASFGWSHTVSDNSTINGVPYGSSYVANQARQRRLSFGFNLLSADEFYQRALGIGLAVGQSVRTVLIPDPDDVGNLERSAICGLISEADFVEPNLAMYSAALKIDQTV